MVKVPKFVSSLASRAKASLLWRSGRFESIKSAMLAHAEYSDNGLRNIKGIKKFGKKFITTFPSFKIAGKKRMSFSVSIGGSTGESPVSVLLSFENTGRMQRPSAKPPSLSSFLLSEKENTLAEASILFDKDSVIISHLQGSLRKERELSRFMSVTGKRWSHYLVGLIESHARECGFGKVKLTTPERLDAYRNPKVRRGLSPQAEEAEKEKIRMQMRKLYYGIANSLNYRKEGDFFVKNL